MQKIRLKILGMACGMCEAHINDAIRGAFPVKKVSASHRKGSVEILTEKDIPEDSLRAVIHRTGYTLVSMEEEPWERRGLLGKRGA